MPGIYPTCAASWYQFVDRGAEGTLIYSGHSDNVFALAWAPDGVFIASGGRDATVQIWNSLSGETIGTYRGHAACLLSLAWSSDGQYIASGCTAGIVQIWQPSNYATITTYRGHKRFVRGLAWSPDGQYIASGGDFGDSTVQIWEARNSKLRSVHNDQYRIFALAWSPAGTRIVSASFDGSVAVREARSGI